MGLALALILGIVLGALVGLVVALWFASTGYRQGWADAERHWLDLVVHDRPLELSAVTAKTSPVQPGDTIGLN